MNSRIDEKNWTLVSNSSFPNPSSLQSRMIQMIYVALWSSRIHSIRYSILFSFILEVSPSKRIEYILEGNLENPSVWILSVPFSLKGRLKCTNHLNVHKLYAVEYINTACSLDYPFQFRIRWIKKSFDL